MEEEKKTDKWEFEDYAFLFTGILVGFLLVGPELLYEFFGIDFFLPKDDGDLGDVITDLVEGEGWRGFSFQTLRALSPFLFLVTTSVCFWKDAISSRSDGGYKGSLFTHTFESLLEDAIYMTITTVMVISAVLFGAMYISWLAGPITFILFVFLLPLLKKKRGHDDEVKTPWGQVAIFVAGLIGEAITGAWIIFPASWLILCAINLFYYLRKKRYSADIIFNMIYYAFSVVLMGVGIVMDFWLASWTAFPIALFIAWILRKTNIIKDTEIDTTPPNEV
ncbi:MAG: hypothetical protein FWB80_12280 [Defluviitaleaceae bacterium]|nr:hypothetical protein [Defluviitaleaceae bacterium]